MNSDLDGEVEVTVTLTGRRATIEDVQQALDTLRAEGIPDTFEVTVNQTVTHEYDKDIPVAERLRTHRLHVSATRAAR